MKLRSKVSWLILGDRNAKFFRIAASIRKSRNSTLMLLNEEGQPRVTRQQLEIRSNNYFKAFYHELQNHQCNFLG